jgi:hypothetical protein
MIGKLKEAYEQGIEAGRQDKLAERQSRYALACAIGEPESTYSGQYGRGYIIGWYRRA